MLPHTQRPWRRDPAVPSHRAPILRKRHHLPPSWEFSMTLGSISIPLSPNLSFHRLPPAAFILARPDSWGAEVMALGGRRGSGRAWLPCSPGCCYHHPAISQDWSWASGSQFLWAKANAQGLQETQQLFKLLGRLCISSEAELKETEPVDALQPIPFTLSLIGIHFPFYNCT